MLNPIWTWIVRGEEPGAWTIVGGAINLPGFLTLEHFLEPVVGPLRQLEATEDPIARTEAPADVALGGLKTVAMERSPSRRDSVSLWRLLRVLRGLVDKVH